MAGRNVVFGLMLTLLLVSMLRVVLNVEVVMATGTIYIRADGSIDPPTAPIQRDGDVYNLTGNITFGSSQNGIVIERNNMTLDGAGYTVQGIMTQPYFTTGYGVILASTMNVTIKNMKVSAYGSGILLDGSSNNTIVANYISPDVNAIHLLWGSDYNTIAENDILGGWEFAVCAAYSNYNRIIRNNITNSANGVYLYLSSNSSIFGNSIYVNTAGVLLEDSTNTSIIENHVTNNEFGILFFDSSNNTIYHNNFVNNTNQADAYNSVNVWDDGYPFGGNYWSDYTDVDLYCGPYQNETGSDGHMGSPIHYQCGQHRQVSTSKSVVSTYPRCSFPLSNYRLLLWTCLP